MQGSSTEHNLTYQIHSWSSYSANYYPSNIQYDNPGDQSSRWSSDSNYPPQYITLKLSQPAIVTSISFGKYEKTHVCNLRKFTIFGGVNEDHMMELLTDGLKNDPQREVFPLRHELNGKKFPCRFIKIVPLMSWGPSFNFSIWHVKLMGIDDQEHIRGGLKWFNSYREQEAIRLCMKYFRQKNYTDVLQALQNRSNILLEHPRLTELHQVLVVNGDFSSAESIIERSAKDNLFQEYVGNQDYKSKWSSIVPLNADGAESTNQPGMRGGHQMVIDYPQQLIFLMGGWDGIKDLSDFWVYSIERKQWTCISEDTKADGGPCARSCHKVCLETKNRNLYMLGRYLDERERAQVELKSDFFKYDLDTGLWELLSEDTSDNGGPQLIFDHQMQYDHVSNQIFVFGGRILSSISSEDPVFSGLFAYQISTNSWTKLKYDNDLTGATIDDCSLPTDSSQLRSRSGHSMLIDEGKRLLYIFAGQRGKEYLNDFFSYNIDTGEIKTILSKTSTKELPSAGFTQRSTIDTDLEEIHVFSGLSKDREKKEDSIRNSFWIYNLKTNKWSCVYKNENVGNQTLHSKVNSIEPRPRFAHQLVYDPKNKVHYLFGGNPGKSLSMKLRLDDFWMLKLERSTRDDLVRTCKYKIRKLRYTEFVAQDPIKALTYLQNEVSELVDHNEQSERDEFTSLASSLFGQSSSHTPEEDSISDQEEHQIPSHIYKMRMEVFDELVAFYPRDMIQPKENLTDFITL